MSRVHPGFPQRFTPGAIRLLRKCRHADISKAKRELGYRPTGLRAAVHEAYAFHYGRNKIANPHAKRPCEDAASRHVTREEGDPAPDQGMRMMAGGSAP